MPWNFADAFFGRALLSLGNPGPGQVPGDRFYHQIGNAVCPPVIEALGAAILEALEASS